MLFFQELDFKGGKSTADEILPANRLTTNFFLVQEALSSLHLETKLLSFRSEETPQHASLHKESCLVVGHVVYNTSGSFWKPRLSPKCSIPPSLLASWGGHSILYIESHSGEPQVSLHLCQATSSRNCNQIDPASCWAEVRAWMSQGVLATRRDLACSPKKC